MRAVLIFPPNWSSCVSSPHLALPLLAAVAHRHNWDAECWDLTEAHSRYLSDPPARESIAQASDAGKFDELDRLYFDWEDQFLEVARPFGNDVSFRMLSGFQFPRLATQQLAAVHDEIQAEGTLFTPFYQDIVLPRLYNLAPDVIAFSIASPQQIIPTLHLMVLVREQLRKTRIVLGGNIVTRLMHTTAFDVFKSLADYVGVFQGELWFGRVLDGIRSRNEDDSLRVGGDQKIAFREWPVPRFAGIDFGAIVGTPAVPYVSTRGCYWGRCHFCAIPAGWSEQGYAGTAPAQFVHEQLSEMCTSTGIRRVKFVDEALAPAKAVRIAELLTSADSPIEWEAYARLERAWENPSLLEIAYRGGLRKLYLGLEQAPSTERGILNKNDQGDIRAIMAACRTTGVKLHLFCMVGHPRSTINDAWETARFLIDHADFVDTADLVGFRLDRGTVVPGVRALPGSTDWQLALPYEPLERGVIPEETVRELEATCQEALWKAAPRLLHPLYRLGGPWNSDPLLSRVRELS